MDVPDCDQNAVGDNEACEHSYGAEKDVALPQEQLVGQGNFLVAVAADHR